MKDLPEWELLELEDTEWKESLEVLDEFDRVLGGGRGGSCRRSACALRERGPGMVKQDLKVFSGGERLRVRDKREKKVLFCFDESERLGEFSFKCSAGEFDRARFRRIAVFK